MLLTTARHPVFGEVTLVVTLMAQASTSGSALCNFHPNNIYRVVNNGALKEPKVLLTAHIFKIIKYIDPACSGIYISMRLFTPTGRKNFKTQSIWSLKY